MSLFTFWLSSLRLEAYVCVQRGGQSEILKMAPKELDTGLGHSLLRVCGGATLALIIPQYSLYTPLIKDSLHVFPLRA